MATKPVLHLVRSLPQRVDDQRCIDFMNFDLARSGLVAEDLGAYPVEPVAFGQTAAYCIPYPSGNGMCRIRYDREVDKYVQPKGMTDVWWSDTQNPSAFHLAPVVYLIEGEKKAAAFIKRWPHLPTFGIGGAHMGVEKIESGGFRLHHRLREFIPDGKEIHVIFDGDIEDKYGIQYAATNLNDACKAKAITLKIFRSPVGKGVDDWLLENPQARVDELVLIDAERLAASKKALVAKLKLTVNEDGQVLKTDYNIVKLLEYYFTDRVYVDKRLGFIKDGEKCDPGILAQDSLKFISSNFIQYASISNIHAATELALVGSRRDLIRDFVLAQKWDGIERLDKWGSRHIITEMPVYANEWGRLLMTGLALRITEPGCKFDYVPMLVGPQAIGKSTFFEDLSLFVDHKLYHSCSDVSSGANDSNRTQLQAFASSVVVDLGEGAVFNTNRKNIDALKQLITLTSDDYRRAYDKFPTIAPRGFIFVGTSNRTDQLNDLTGSRRFLMLKTSKIVKLSYEDKLQILAEVVEKRAADKLGNWYDLKVSVDDLPEALRKEHPHLTNAQALVNSQFHQPNILNEIIGNMLEGEACACVDVTGEFFITPTTVALFTNESELRHKAAYSKALKSLSESPDFPFKLTPARKRPSQLVYPATEDTKNFFLMLEASDKGVQMISGYIATRR